MFKIPTDADGLQELLNNAAQMKEVFGNPKSTKEFFTAYSTNFVKNNPDTTADIRDQVQAVCQVGVAAVGFGEPPGADGFGQVHLVTPSRAW